MIFLVHCELYNNRIIYVPRLVARTRLRKVVSIMDHHALVRDSMQV